MARNIYRDLDTNGHKFISCKFNLTLGIFSRNSRIHSTAAQHQLEVILDFPPLDLDRTRIRVGYNN